MIIDPGTLVARGPRSRRSQARFQPAPVVRDEWCLVVSRRMRPGGHGDAPGCAPVAGLFDLAQNLSVERRGECHTTLSTGEERDRVESFVIELVGVSDLVA